MKNAPTCFIYPSDEQLDCSKKNVKIYIKIYMKNAPTRFIYPSDEQLDGCIRMSKYTLKFT